MKYLFKVSILSIITIVVIIALRVFLFASFKIPSSSLEPSLLPGDYVIVNKLVPGPRVDWWPNKKKEDFFRGKGSRAIQRNDVLIFNELYHNSSKIERNIDRYYVKRCISIPGDTFYIEDGIYKVRNVPDTLGYYKYQNEISDYVDLKHFKPEMFSKLGWTITSFGPIYIPHKNAEIKLDSTNFHVYKTLVEYESNGILEYRDKCFLLNGKIVEGYRFQQNYYFVAGDFALDSDDSRYWGLLPEDHIIGKVSYIWKSRDLSTGKYRFDRFFRSVE